MLPNTFDVQLLPLCFFLAWHTFTVDLQHQILARMRGLGMTPILPAFAGHIPKGMIDIYKPNYTEQVRISDEPKRQFK